MVDDDVLLADLGRGEALLAERDLQRDAGGDDLLRDDRIAGLDRERLAQLCRFARRPLRARAARPLSNR